MIHYGFRTVNQTAALPVSVGAGESQDSELSLGINSRLKGCAFLAQSQGSRSLSSN